MGITQITFDVTGWPRRAVDELMAQNQRIDDLVLRSSEKPAGFAEREIDVVRHARAWREDVKQFLEEHPDTPKRLRTAFFGVRVYTSRRDLMLKKLVWILPGLKGFMPEYRFDSLLYFYPTFEQMLRQTEKDPSNCPLDGVGKHWGVILNEIASQEPVKPPPPPLPEPEPERVPRTDGKYTCAYCFGSGCPECKDKGGFDDQPRRGC